MTDRRTDRHTTTAYTALAWRRAVKKDAARTCMTIMKTKVMRMIVTAIINTTMTMIM